MSMPNDSAVSTTAPIRDRELEAFLALLAARRSPRTVDAYRRDLARLSEFLGKPIGKATVEELERYTAQLRADGLAATTIALIGEVSCVGEDSAKAQFGRGTSVASPSGHGLSTTGRTTRPPLCLLRAAIHLTEGMFVVPHNFTDEVQGFWHIELRGGAVGEVSAWEKRLLCPADCAGQSLQFSQERSFAVSIVQFDKNIIRQFKQM